MHAKFTIEFVALIALCLWLFNLLSYVRPMVKDVVNSVAIILLILFYFFL